MAIAYRAVLLAACMLAMLVARTAAVTCSSNQWDNSGTCVDCSDSLAQCTACSSGTTCTQCTFGSGTAGYELTSGSCSQCASNQYNSANSSTCMNCAANCATCTSSTSCTACNDGYGVSSGSCIQCMANCADCSDSTSCITAMPGFFAHGASVTVAPTACHEKCATCTAAGNAGGSCTTCADGYALEAGVCERDPEIVGLALVTAALVVLCGFTLAFFCRQSSQKSNEDAAKVKV